MPRGIPRTVPDKPLVYHEITVHYSDGSTDTARAEGNNATWHCQCDDPLPLVGRCYYQFGWNCHAICPTCGKSYRYVELTSLAWPAVWAYLSTAMDIYCAGPAQFITATKSWASSTLRTCSQIRQFLSMDKCLEESLFIRQFYHRSRRRECACRWLV